MNKGLQFRIVGIIAWLSIIIITVWLTLSGYVMTWAQDNIIVGVMFVLIMFLVAQGVFVLFTFIGGKKGANNKLQAPKVSG